MSTTMPLASRSRSPELDVDDVRGAVQALGRPEDVARQAVGNHHVPADGHAVHAVSTSRGGTARRRVSAARSAITPGSDSKSLSPVISASSAGSLQQRQRELHPPARVPSRRCGRRRRCRPVTTSASAAARETRRRVRQRNSLVAVPAQLDDRRLESRRCASASSRPAAEPLAWITRSAFDDACSGVANARPARRAIGGALRVDVDQLHVAAGHTSRQPRHEASNRAGADHAIRSPMLRRASHKPLIAVSRLAASTARSGGTAAGRTCTRRGRNDVARLMRIQRRTRRGRGDRPGPSLDRVRRSRIRT